MYRASFWIVYSTFCLVLITATTLNTRVQPVLHSASVALLGEGWPLTGRSRVQVLLRASTILF